jgi:hypothetical protein
MQGVIGKLAGKSPLGTRRYRWEDNSIRVVDIKESEWAGMDWFNLVQGSDKNQAVVSMVMNHWIL